MSGKSNGSSELPLQPPTSSLRCRTCSFVVTSLCRNDNYAPVEASRTKMCYEPPVTSANNQLLTDILNFLSICAQQWGEWRFSPPYRRKSSWSHTRWFLVYLMLRLNQKGGQRVSWLSFKPHSAGSGFVCSSCLRKTLQFCICTWKYVIWKTIIGP